jgi:MFS transporter, MHS family, shikimate and dehydroshikimate transport protein
MTTHTIVTDPTSPEEVTPGMLRRVAAATAIGTAVEWYDFFIYGTAAALVFNKLFFPSFEPLVGTLAALSTYAVGFIARPLGGVVFGHIGDKVGRKGALVATLLIVGIGTFVIGLMPTYERIGMWAPIGLVFIRLLQGFGVGGEQGNAILIMCEHAPPNQRGFYGSWVQIGAPAGFLLPSALFAILTATQSEETFLAWGWRIPFLLSIVLVGIGLYIRVKLTESPLFVKVRKQHAEDSRPVVDVVREYSRQILLGSGAKIAESALFTIYAVVVVAYAVNRGIPKNVIANAILIAVAIELFTLPLFGALSDRIGRRPVYLGGAVLQFVIAFPFFMLVNTAQKELVWLAMVLVLSVGHAAMYGPQAAFFSELFPTRLRASGVSLVQQFGSLVGGGLASILTAWFLQLSGGEPWLIAGYIAVLAAITAASVVVLPETAPRVAGRHAEEEFEQVAQPTIADLAAPGGRQ